MQLAFAAVGNSIQTLNRVHRFGKVVEQQVVAIQLGLDRLEHVHRVAFVATDQADKVPVTVEHGPDAGAFTDRGFSTTPRHGHREQSAM